MPETAAEDEKALAKAGAALRAARAQLEERAAALADLSARPVAPRPEAVRVLAAALHLTGATREALGDAQGLDPRAPYWPAVAARVGGDALLAALRAYEPEAPAAAGPVPPFARSDALRALAAGPTPEELNRACPALGALAAFVSAAVDVRDGAAAKRAREEAEAKAKAEAEAKAALAGSGDADAGEAAGEGEEEEQE
jgi:hypothetical protein